jgi:hypothetical protein
LETFESVVVEWGFIGNPKNIYSIDETGCRLSLHHTQEVSSAKDFKLFHWIPVEDRMSALSLAAMR